MAGQDAAAGLAHCHAGRAVAAHSLGRRTEDERRMQAGELVFVNRHPSTIMAVALGLDVGERRIGVAASDATGLLASPLTTILRSSDAAALQEIGRLAAERNAEVAVVGLPLSRAGEMTPQAQRIHAFGRKLRALPGLRVVFWDETLSTTTATGYLAD